MSYILFDAGKKIGEISDWRTIDRPAEKRMVLGKEVEMGEKSGQRCTFTSPKPLNRRSTLTVVFDKKTEYVLQQTKIIGGTEIAADIVSTRAL